ncbi:Erythroid differentiation-related factor [Ooceraea biroi]|uniref:Erythroid differentiation-related factor n=1 Tax=Ooceraea biroi TaxID=2015173 RepID=A0A026WFL6_OOCBI|nr:Erythroid differentiation-related factor [Ooceraea biroi]
MALVVPPDSPKKPVKSTAVVKYSTVQTPATYAQLQCNTDLNLPPSNWLSSSAESYGLQNVWSQSTGFSSFRMAHMFPDCVGEVDVVSDAENIKKLLKLPYYHGVISMMVHRIENTLLLDDFDIHKYLLRQAKSDWEWLKKFFYEHIFQNLGDKEKRLFHKAYSRNSLQQRNLISKFLYHSIVLADSNKQNEKPQLPVKPLEPCLPEPTQEEKVPDPNYNHNYTRNVVWTFENIQMLIGTDMPIFGGQTHPCISLRLRDMSKPINVLTGIDYWLDNLMCNVPEVVMCYHLDGIVQKYELIKTEDLPNLDDSKFSSKVIRDVAQNILSFLKNNATKAGHTYWLFKGENDDVVKLYDLTSLCSDVSEDKGQNPFTVPVAMLLYRVARNMKYSPDYHRHQGTIRMLLKNCVQLLVKEKYPQIVTSAHFMLSDLYVPSDTDPASPRLLDQSEEEDAHSEYSTNHENEKEESEEEQTFAAIKSLTLANIKEQAEREQPKYKPPPISGTIEERCLSGLEHVTHGLECLRYMLEVLHCQKILEIFCGVRNDKSISYLLGRAGDCCFMIVQDWCNVKKHRKDYEIRNEMAEKIVEEVYNMDLQDLDMNGAELLPKGLESLEFTMICSYKCYEKALSLESMDIDRNNLLRRLGNIHNELGVFYMNQAGSRYKQQENQTDKSSNSSDVTALLTCSLTHLESGIKAFETVHDETNLALLHSNTGRLMRLCAHVNDKQNTQERHYYNKALTSYQKALQVLGSRKTNQAIWDTVTWDLSTTLYTMATLLQDYPIAGHKSEEEMEREVVDILQKALKHCDVDTPGPRQPVYQFRAASIQHRLASLYHHVYREFESDVDNSKKKMSLQLCKLYYDKATKLLLLLEQSTEYLTVQLERIALAEYQAHSGTTFNSKLKAYQNGLDLVLQCIPIIQILCERNNMAEQKTKEVTDNELKNDSAEHEKVVEEQKLIDGEEKLVILLEQRLQFLLRSLTKLFLSKSPVHNRKEYDKLTNLYKQCYIRTLRPDTMSGFILIKHVMDVLRQLNCMLKQMES